MFFPFTQTDLKALMAKDERLAKAIEVIGLIEREVDEGFYDSLVHQIIGQQISNKALSTIYARLKEAFDPEPVDAINMVQKSIEQLQACGISKRKAQTILAISDDIAKGLLDLKALEKEDPETIKKVLTSYKGIGNWTVEMVLIFGLKKMDVFSFSDLAIQKGLKVLYEKESLSKEDLKDFQARFSPYGSLASLYLWHIAAHPDLIEQIRVDFGRQKDKEIPPEAKPFDLL